MSELVTGVNWTAVIVGFVLSFLLGWLWYSPKLFGNKWAEGVGITLSKDMPFPAMAMLFQVSATFGLSWLFGITAAKQHLLIIILVVVTLILFIVSNGKFAQKSNAAVAIEAGFVFAMAIILFLSQAIF